MFNFQKPLICIVKVQTQKMNDFAVGLPCYLSLTTAYSILLVVNSMRNNTIFVCHCFVLSSQPYQVCIYAMHFLISLFVLLINRKIYNILNKMRVYFFTAHKVAIDQPKVLHLKTLDLYKS